MNTDFLKTTTPEVWTREQKRTEQFADLENEQMRCERMHDWEGVLYVSRMILRLQMEVMEEKNKDDKTVLRGKETELFKKQKDALKDLETKYRESSKNFHDPAAKLNARQDMHELIDKIRDFVDDLYHNNTILGLNYRKKNDPMKAAYS